MKTKIENSVKRGSLSNPVSGASVQLRPLTTYQHQLSSSKRDSILKTARKVFLTCGFSGAAMAEIAQDADVSTATLYKHFESKEALFAATVADFYDDFERPMEALIEGMTVSEALFHVARNFVHRQYDQETNSLLRMVWAEIHSAPQLARDLFERGSLRRYTDLRKLLDRYVEKGQLKPHDTELGARQFSGLVKEFLVWPALYELAYPLPANAEDILREAVTTYLARFGA